MTEHVLSLPCALDPLIAEAKRRMRRRRLLVASVACVLVLSLSSYFVFASFEHGPAAPPTVAVQAGSILSQARVQHSVHYTSWESMGAVATDYTTGDVSNGRGVLLLRQHYWSSIDNKRHWGIVTVVVIGRNAYIRGTARGLGVFAHAELTPREARRYAGRWISIPRGSNLHFLAEGGTLASFLSQITVRGRLRRFASTLNGRKVIGIEGTGPAGQSFVLARSSTLLPVEAGYDAGSGQGRTSISRWNEPVRVKAPAHSIPLSSLRRR